MSKALLALYGLKYNPFVPGVPTEALQVSPRIDSFRRRVRAGECSVDMGLPTLAQDLGSTPVPGRRRRRGARTAPY